MVCPGLRTIRRFSNHRRKDSRWRARPGHTRSTSRGIRRASPSVEWSTFIPFLVIGHTEGSGLGAHPSWPSSSASTTRSPITSPKPCPQRGYRPLWDKITLPVINHAGGRGFESRRSRKSPANQPICCLLRRKRPPASSDPALIPPADSRSQPVILAAVSPAGVTGGQRWFDVRPTPALETPATPGARVARSRSLSAW